MPTVLEPIPAFQATYETQQLVNRLKQLVEANDHNVIPYSELSAIAGGDVQHDSKPKGYLRTARETCEKECNRLFGVVPGIGVKLLAPGQEQAGFANDRLTRMRRASRRSKTRISRIQWDQMKEEDRRLALLALTFVSTVAAFSSPSRLKRLDAEIAKSGAALPVATTLALFSPKK